MSINRNRIRPSFDCVWEAVTAFLNYLFQEIGTFVNQYMLVQLQDETKRSQLVEAVSKPFYDSILAIFLKSS